MKFINKQFYSLLFTSSTAMVITAVLCLSTSIVAGQIIGDFAISSVNLVLPIFSAITFISIMISIGTSASYSYEMGKFNKIQANKMFGQGVILAVCSGIVMFLLIIFGKSLYFEILASPAIVYEHASAYYDTLAYIGLIYPLHSLLADMIYTEGDEIICNISYAIQIFGNLFFSIVLCNSIGIQGISLGTLIGTLFSIGVLVIHFFKKGNSLKFKYHICLKDVIHVAKFGTGDGLQFLSNSILLYMLNIFIITYFDISSLTTLSIVINVMELGIIFDGVGQALAPLLGIYRGEKNKAGIVNIVNTAQRSAIAEGIIFSIILIVFANYIPVIFGIKNTEIIVSSALAIRIMATTAIFSSLTYLYTSYYLFMEKIYLSMFMTILSDLLVILVVGISLSYIIGINGLWIGFALAPVIALFLGWLIVYKQYGKTSVPLLFDKTKINNTFIFNIILSPKNIIPLCDDVEQVLKNHHIPQKVLYKVILIIEEMTTLIIDKNQDNKIYFECTIMIEDKLRIIFRDSGVIFNITDTDMSLSSLNAYVVSSIMEHHKTKVNLTTMGYNRNEFIF